MHKKVFEKCRTWRAFVNNAAQCHAKKNMRRDQYFARSHDHITIAPDDILYQLWICLNFSSKSSAGLLYTRSSNDELIHCGVCASSLEARSAESEWTTQYNLRFTKLLLQGSERSTQKYRTKAEREIIITLSINHGYRPLLSSGQTGVHGISLLHLRA